MFQRVLYISAMAAAIVAVIFLWAISPDLSPSGTAHADHSDRPHLEIESITPEVGEEGRHLTVTLKLSRPLKDNEKYCYNAVPVQIQISGRMRFVLRVG